MPSETTPKKQSEGKVNVPLGPRKKDLRRIAHNSGTTETNLARVLIIHGLELIVRGELKFTGPSLSQTRP